MARDDIAERHKIWLGMVQPVGLVVSPPALAAKQAVLSDNVIEPQQVLAARVAHHESGARFEGTFAQFAAEVLNWPPEAIHNDAATLQQHELALPVYDTTLLPDYAVHDVMGEKSLLMLVRELPPEANLDAKDENAAWHASHHDKFERLLRDAEVSTGLIFNGRELRLIYAPRGETSGHITFNVSAMVEVAGRPILGALLLLLGAHRVFDAPDGQRLPDLLNESRKYQVTVSTLLAEQVLDALWDMLRGFQAADEIAQHKLIGPEAGIKPEEVYGGLLATLLRLVFLLYAEDQGLMPNDPVYQQNYAVSGLFIRLRDDAAKHPDTMDQRFGAWGWLLSLFRLVHDGTRYTGFSLPARYGKLFDPEAHPFLEGRAKAQPLQAGQTLNIPRVSDGCIFRVLSSLLLLKGERLSYRSLDVEQIGSVYEAVMGFEVERAKGRSIGVRKPKKGVSVDVVFDVDALLTVPAKDRAKRFAELTDSDLPEAGEKALKAATTADEVAAAVGKRKSRRTPELLPPGALYLQPGEERRRTGSHYTPRNLTEPIVRKTLEPILKRTGDRPTPQQILDLKVCDPAMGSGAFLVEACRQLAEQLVRSWEVHNATPKDMLGEEPRMHARRLVAQRCLYGVDKNPFAVDLAKLSLWLVTLAKNQPFTFLDHALRAGDSLVGLSRQQIARFHWDPKAQREIGQKELEQRIETAAKYRTEILDGGDYMPPLLKAQKLALAEQALEQIRVPGDLLVAAFFNGEKPKEREALRDEYLKLHNTIELRKDAAAVKEQLAAAAKRKQVIANLRQDEWPITPFHWEVEFPEVFNAENPGFDAMVGNPPFLGGSQLSDEFGGSKYQDWLKERNEGAFGNADLSAYFFRRAYALVCKRGAFGLLATKSISEGGTRTTGLQSILASGAAIYNAVRFLKWPGDAAVLVAVVHIAAEQAQCIEPRKLDGKPVDSINSRLHAGAELPDPVPLAANKLNGFFGTKLGSDGFILSASEHAALAQNPHNLACLLPYLGGEEVNHSPTQSHERYSIYFGSEPLAHAQQFPELLEIVRTRVKPARDRALNHGPGAHGKKYWWQFTLRADPLYENIQNLPRCLVTAITTKHLAFSFQPIRQVFSHSLVAFAFDGFGPFACLQCRLHTIWSELLSSYLGGTLRYSVSDAFHTYPFPPAFLTDTALEIAGRDCYEFRANLMVRNDEGLTKTYNRFHDPAESSPDIHKLRELHAAMDRAVLDAYGWQNIQPVCGFGLDYLELDDDSDTKPSAEAQKIIDQGNLWFPTAAEALQFAAGLNLSGKKRLPWRYRWPEETRDEVLAKLLELNAQRAKEEQQTGAAAQAKEKKAAGKPRKGTPDGGQDRANMFS